MLLLVLVGWVAVGCLLGVALGRRLRRTPRPGTDGTVAVLREANDIPSDDPYPAEPAAFTARRWTVAGRLAEEELATPRTG